MFCSYSRRGLAVSLLTASSLTLLLGAGVGCSKPNTLRPLLSEPLKREVAKGGAPVHTELLRVIVTLNEDGTYTRREEHRYRILDNSGVENWGHVHAYYSPWYMSPPGIEARVINGRQTTPLDPAVLTQQPAHPSAPDIYGDSLVIRGPLPSVRIGSIIEETIVTQTHKPFLAPNSLHYVTFASAIPKDKVELIVSAPASMKMNFEVRDAKVTRSERTENGRRIYTFEGGPSEGLEEPEPLIPNDVPYWPSVAFSTGAPWKELAGVYGKIVDERLQGVDFKSIVSQVISPSDSEKEKIAKLHAWVKERVRYIGIEFGESSVIPYAPDDVVARGFGDCKDQATLLVGLLRAAGLKADVALLRAGTGEDILATLPSFGGFNHAIVYVGGKRPLWIDPTADLLPVGSLPTGDQARFSLVASSGTRDLVKTPASTAADNSRTDERVVTLKDHGDADVVEVTRASGMLDWNLRSTFSGSEKDITEFLQDYVQRAYDSKELGNVKHGDASALLTPFESLIEAKKAKSAHTSLLRASARLAEGSILSWVPDALREADEEDEKRTSEMQLLMPYTADIVWTVRPPEGFVPREKPEPVARKFGTSDMVRTVDTNADGSVTMRTRFELGKRRLSAQEVQSFRDDYAAWTQTRMPYAVFEHRSQKLVREGDVAGGVQILRDEVKKAPTSSLARLRLAQTLEPFLFDVARSEVQATAKTPTNDSEILIQIGHLLSNNLVGDDLGKGFDRDGTIAAYRKAAELDKENTYAKLRHAITLETHESGDRYFASQADLEKALEVYAAISAKELREYDDGKFKNNAIVTLYWADKHDELRRRLTSMPLEEVPPNLALMNEAARVGTVEAVQKEAERLSLKDEVRSEGLEQAARTFTSARKYPEAERVLKAAMETTKNPDRLQSRLAMTRRSKAVNLKELPEETPEQVAIKVLVYSIAKNEFDIEYLKKYISKDAYLKKEESFVATRLKDQRLDRNPVTLSEDLFGDMIYGAMHATTEGSDKLGYRVKITQETSQAGLKHTVYVVREGGKYKVRAVLARNSELGAEALNALSRGNDAMAKQWLDWARETLGPYEEKEPLRALPFHLVWAGPDGKKKGDVSVKLAAAMLAVESDSAERALPVLSAALATEKDPDVRILILSAQNQVHVHQKNYEAALTTADLLVKELPDSVPAFWKRMSALSKLRRFKDYETGVRQRLSKGIESERIGLTRSLASSLVAQGKIAEGMKVRKRLIDKREANGGDYNDQAWDGAFIGATQEHLEHALRAVESEKDTSSLHTLATIYVELGKLNDAARTLRELLGSRKDREPKNIDHYILGRIAEHLGYKDVARAHYRKVEKPEFASVTATFELAKRRLAQL